MKKVVFPKVLKTKYEMDKIDYRTDNNDILEEDLKKPDDNRIDIKHKLTLGKILNNNNDEAITECIIVARDLMRKYKGRSLELIKKITIDLIESLNDPNSKSAAFYIVGEFCTMIPDSTNIIKHFVDNFSNSDIVSKIKLQILNATVKNFVNKPDEGEEIVKLCLQKGAEESENPDVRDRAYIYWRLLETDPDVAKDMVVSEKPPFEFNDDNNLIDSDVVDDIIDNMTNVSAVYLKKGKELIPEEDMIIDATAPKVENEEKEEKEEKKEEKEIKKKRKKRKKNMSKNHKISLMRIYLDWMKILFKIIIIIII